MEGLRTSQVHRNLDTKLKIVGLEIHDLLFVLLMASVMNLVFGRTSVALYFVFLLPTSMALGLFVVKRNKPENFLLHWSRYFMSPGFYSAGQAADRQHSVGRIVPDEG